MVTDARTAGAPAIPEEGHASWAALAHLATMGLGLWAIGSQGDFSHCDWYCGPAPYFVAVAAPGLTICTWFVALLITVVVIFKRRWMTALACGVVLLSGPLILASMYLANHSTAG